MHDRNPVRSVLSILLPCALLVTVLWLLAGSDVQDALFAFLKLVVTR